LVDNHKDTNFNPNQQIDSQLFILNLNNLLGVLTVIVEIWGYRDYRRESKKQ